MEINKLHKEIIYKKQQMLEITAALKSHFIGLDVIIDEVMSLLSSWYLFPQAQLRPMVINLWGLTGSGKTALVQKLVELLDYKKFYAQMDMGEFESDSASWIKNTLTDELEFFHDQPCIICLDEFQFSRTIDRDGKELGKDKLRVVWDLVDSGKISYIPSNNTYYIRRADAFLFSIAKAIEEGVIVEKGIVVSGAVEFLDCFKGFYFENQGRNNAVLDINYFLSKDFIEGVYYLFNDEVTSKEHIEEEIKSSGLEEIAALLMKGIKTRTAVRTLNLSRALIFILGNLDEAYGMSHSINPDISADELYEATSKINLTNIKAALKKRFRPEQIARLGNNHIIYRAFKSEHFRELIRRELVRINGFVNDQFEINIIYQPAINELIYKEGVFPAQGTRPVLTSVKNYIESWIGKIVLEVIERNHGIKTVEWDYCDDRYIFIFKDAQNQVLNIYEEKVQLKMDHLRRTVDRDLQAHTAVHESGHAVLAVLTLHILPSLVVSRSAADYCEGFCMVNYPEGIYTRDILRKNIIISLGGFVAERMIFGKENTSSGVAGDIENASEWANRAIKYFAMGSDPVALLVGTADNTEYFQMEEKYRKEAIDLVFECEKEAEQILERNKLLLLIMAEYLTDHYKMEEEKIGAMVTEYGNDDWIRKEGFRKKEHYFSFESMLKEQIAKLNVTV